MSVASQQRALRCVELFSGGGGLALGIEQAGFDHVALVEWDEHARYTIQRNNERDFYRKQWPLCEEADARKVDFRKFEDVDLVAGGPPCQPFSLGGVHRAKDDDRDMFPTMIRAIAETSPRAFIVENVPGLARPRFQSYVDHIKRKLRNPTGRLRYTVHFVRVCCADYGAPQLRNRVLFVGFRKDLDVKWQCPSATHSREALEYIQQVTGEYWQRHGLDAPRAKKGQVPPGVPPSKDPPKAEAWKTTRDAIAALGAAARRANRVDQSCNQHVLIPGAREYAGHTGSDLDWPAKTLKAGVHGVPGGENMVRLDNGRVRYFTVREAAVLQGFPEDYLFEGAWVEVMRQIGNAVPVMMARAFAESVSSALGQ